MRIDEVKFFELSKVEYKKYIKKRLLEIGMYLKSLIVEKFMIDGIRFRFNNRYEKIKDGLRIFIYKKDVVFIEILE